MYVSEKRFACHQGKDKHKSDKAKYRNKADHEQVSNQFYHIEVIKVHVLIMPHFLLLVF
jgi:hypothetical protein